MILKTYDETLLVRPCAGRDTGAFMQQGPFWRYHFDANHRFVPCPPGVMGFHSGRDIACVVGTPLISPLDGEVLAAGFQDPTDHSVGLGHFVKIRSARAYPAYDGVPIPVVVFLAHLSEHFVTVGSTVEAGKTTLALSGATGHVQGPHVHAQVQDPRGPGIIPLPFEWCDLAAYRNQKER